MRFIQIGFISMLLWLTACAGTPSHQNQIETIAPAYGGALESSMPAKKELAGNVKPIIPAAKSAPQKLGTQWGESLSSNVIKVQAQRAGTSPEATAAIYYNDVVNKGRYLKKIQLGAVEMSIVNPRNLAYPMYVNGRGYQLQGRDGDRYQLRFVNTSRNQSYEVVATVDGLDVLSGRSGSYANSGYILNPGATLVIEGFRKSAHEVAAFRFSSVAASYAAHSVAGDTNNAGVIGAAIFRLKQDLPTCKPQAFPNNGYAPAPCQK